MESEIKTNYLGNLPEWGVKQITDKAILVKY